MLMSIGILLFVILRIALVLKKLKLQRLLFLHGIKLSKRLAVYSYLNVNSDFIIEVFNMYKRGVDFYNPYVSIDRYQEKKKKDE